MNICIIQGSERIFLPITGNLESIKKFIFNIKFDLIQLMLYLILCLGSQIPICLFLSSVSVCAEVFSLIIRD